MFGEKVRILTIDKHKFKIRWKFDLLQESVKKRVKRLKNIWL